jgi:hypothetical protein
MCYQVEALFSENLSHTMQVSLMAARFTPGAFSIRVRAPPSHVKHLEDRVRIQTALTARDYDMTTTEETVVVGHESLRGKWLSLNGAMRPMHRRWDRSGSLD